MRILLFRDIFGVGVLFSEKPAGAGQVFRGQTQWQQLVRHLCRQVFSVPFVSEPWVEKLLEHLHVQMPEGASVRGDYWSLQITMWGKKSKQQFRHLHAFSFVLSPKVSNDRALRSFHTILWCNMSGTTMRRCDKDEFACGITWVSSLINHCHTSAKNNPMERRFSPFADIRCSAPYVMSFWVGWWTLRNACSTHWQTVVLTQQTASSIARLHQNPVELEHNRWNFGWLCGSHNSLKTLVPSYLSTNALIPAVKLLVQQMLHSVCEYKSPGPTTAQLARWLCVLVNWRVATIANELNSLHF